jgi:polysaccharide export outer membrane protein
MRRNAAFVSLLASGASPVLTDAAQVFEVGAGDVLKITVTGQTGLSGEFPVDSAGMLLYPCSGKVKASGLTTQALEKKLVTLLSDGT